MTLDDVKQYFGTSYQFNKKTKMNHSNYLNWKNQGFIPIKTQLKLERISEGFLRANLDHIDRGFDDRERNKGIGRAEVVQTTA